MTRVTQITGQWMTAGFESARTHAIVTARAGAGLTGDCGVIERTDEPGGSGMTTVAG